MSAEVLKNEYERAAESLKEDILTYEVEIQTQSKDIENTLKTFQQKFSPEILARLDDSDLLSSLFYTVGDSSDSLCYWLEMHPECRGHFGSIAGGSAYKFGLFQRKETGEWTTGNPKKPQVLTEKEAIELGKKIRDALITGVEIIRNATLDSLTAYEKLDDTLTEALGEKISHWSWVHKYFSLICNDKLSGFHSDEWQFHVLRSLRIRPSEKYYARSGQIAMVQNHNNWYYYQFFEAFFGVFGAPIQFIRLGCQDDSVIYAKEWAKDGVVGIGWPKLGDLTTFVKAGIFDRNSVRDSLYDLYYPNNLNKASTKAGELERFYVCDTNSTVFVIMLGQKLLAFAEPKSDYYFDGTSGMPHKRKANWKYKFNPNEDKLPTPGHGGKMTSCYQISKDENNMMFLYEKYFYGEEVCGVNDMPGEGAKVQIGSLPIRFKTGFTSSYERNRIIFGAPGTGKSYMLNQEAKDLIGEDNGTDYERVTFHPDYSYANFVGTYKPVPMIEDDKTIITYEYVPGPFMRVYVKALKNSKTENIKPYLLIIEEINRANVAAVFGDIFQLLDRNDDQFSEYPIEATEDMKRYLVKELGGKPEEYSKIYIPDNMFIWATMNSADQGVFPVDTAFKRRWDFTYIGIDDSDSDIHGKYVTLGSEAPQRVEWNSLRKAINHFLANEKINEDKQLGPYFIARKYVVPAEGDEIDSDSFSRVFKNKVIMYLFEDAAKQKRSKLFEGCGLHSSRYSEICKEFDKKGIGIFNQTIQNEAKAEDVEIVEE